MEKWIIEDFITLHHSDTRRKGTLVSRLPGNNKTITIIDEFPFWKTTQTTSPFAIEEINE